MTVARHPRRAHLVAVTTADDRVLGSGYLLNSRVVLTAGHVVEDVAGDDLRVCRMVGLRTVRAEVVRVERDIALLLTAEEIAEPGDLSEVEMSELAADAHFDDCSALGLPTVMTRPAAGVAPLEADFRIAPNSAEGHGYLSLQLVGHPPQGVHPWGGMSGAPVFHAGRWLVGVIVRDAAGWGHARLEAAPIGGFFEAVPFADRVFRVTRAITETDARDAAYLDVYRREVVRRYGHIELFGLGLRGLADDIGIEHAYVSLHAGLRSLGLSSTDQSRPVEHLIPKNARMLLRGDPGAGKSTLLEWLAVSMARQSCRGPLESFNARVPFLIRLRDMYAPRWKQEEGLDGIPPEPDRFLDFNRIATGTRPPDGWVRRLLDDDRALLLVDGLDEVLEAHRDGVLRWIVGLLREFPSVRIIVTGRPEALVQWSPPKELGFVELRLLELNETQRAELIRKWHQAAKLGARSSWLGDEERERRTTRLSVLETGLNKLINASPDLAALAATPLLCAVLCKLHEVHGSRLPRFRQELYARTIDMMLGLRDADREVPDPLPHLDVDQRRAILSWVAGYLTTEGEREITQDRFDEKVGQRLGSLGREAGAHSPEEIRRALQQRSGLLVAPAEESLRFSHRTFQDYLAATDMVAQRAFGQLAGHAGEETWDDVLHFAMSQCNLADTREFVAQFRRKLRVVAGGRQRARMRMAAAACIPYAVQMDEDDRRSLISGVAKSFRTVAKKSGTKTFDFSPYTAVGPDLLAALQRDFDWQDGLLCLHAVYLASEVAGPESLQFLKHIPRDQRQVLSAQLAAAWDQFPGAEFADDVLAGLDVEALAIDTAERLTHARVVGHVDRLTVSRADSVEDIAGFALGHRVQHLRVTGNVLGDDVSLAPLSRATALSTLSLGTSLPTLHQVFRTPGFWIRTGRSRDKMRYALPAIPHVTELALAALPTDWAEHTAGWTGLTWLGLFAGAVEALTELTSLPALTHLIVQSERSYTIPATLVHDGVTHLALQLPEGPEYFDLHTLPKAFPALTELVLTAPSVACPAVDLSSVARLPGLVVRLGGFSRNDARIRGIDAFAKERVSWE
ncbi:NACHT domain-containing protein [Streptomyces sp. Tue6028]|uniref:NACHT domain-containing protein n=1 Tax=Streptomyces sp. Tue6028 TaxID=2036037 RepID=UPI003D70CD51